MRGAAGMWLVFTRLWGYLTGTLPQALLCVGHGPVCRPHSWSPRTCRGPTSSSSLGPRALCRGPLEPMLRRPQWLNPRPVARCVQKDDKAPLFCGHS